MEKLPTWFKKLDAPTKSGKDPLLRKHADQKAQKLQTLLERNEVRARMRKKAGRAPDNYLALFSGPSGTGKTLAASFLGKSKGKEVFQVDLSMVISKYIGETEKNLARIFEEGMQKGWILFFDEADALFGKRTQVQSVSDRFSAEGAPFLLKEIQKYPGMVILSTREQPRVRSTFRSRINTTIHFPVPGGSPTKQSRFWRKWFFPKPK